MTDNEIYAEFDRLKTLNDQLLEETVDSNKQAKRELVDTLRSVALLSGAVAVGALVLLSTTVTIDKDLILIGICDLLLLTVAISVYLVHIHVDTIGKNEEIIFGVINRFEKFFKFLDERKLEETSEILDQVILKLNKIQKKVPSTESKFRYTEVLITASLGFGTIMIVLGLLLPQVV